MQPLFISSWIHRCFILHIIIFIYSVTQVVPALAIWSTLRLTSVSFWHTIIFLKHFLTFFNTANVPGSPCIFPAPVLESYSSPKALILLVKPLESPLDNKEIKPVKPKGNQSWTFIGRTDAEAEAPILWPLDAKSWLIQTRLSYWTTTT